MGKRPKKSNYINQNLIHILQNNPQNQLYEYSHVTTHKLHLKSHTNTKKNVAEITRSSTKSITMEKTRKQIQRPQNMRQ